jgi:hypothetical protein
MTADIGEEYLTQGRDRPDPQTNKVLSGLRKAGNRFSEDEKNLLDYDDFEEEKKTNLFKNQ